VTTIGDWCRYPFRVAKLTLMTSKTEEAARLGQTMQAIVPATQMRVAQLPPSVLIVILMVARRGVTVLPDM
jgi:hypothetical protein